MIRAGLTSNSPHALVDVTAANGVEFLRRYTTGGATTQSLVSGVAPYWVKLVRNGDSFAAYTSANGTSWTLLGVDTVAMGTTVYAGLVVCSHDNTQLNTATFDNLNVSDAWTSEDVGAVGLTGGATQDLNARTFTISGAGADIYGTVDAFHYVDQPLYGNGSISAQVLSIAPTNAYWKAKAGVMIRQDLTSGSAHATADVTPGFGVEVLARTTSGGSTVNTDYSGPVAPYWVKIARTGNTFVGSRSSDGVTWTAISTNTITMTSPVYVGLIVCAHSITNLCTDVFGNVVVTPAP
jgi:regulation of enolase protein 1 (concanavalin A-like superfamily)